jgi:hypothetical protein
MMLDRLKKTGRLTGYSAPIKLDIIVVYMQLEIME